MAPEFNAMSVKAVQLDAHLKNAASSAAETVPDTKIP